MHDITPPAHPLPPGGQMPDLNLAGSAGFNVASGQSIQSQPDPGKPVPYIPVLSGSPDLGGINPASAVPTLNLAGVEGVPPPAQLVKTTADNGIHQPDFGLPDFTQAALKQESISTPAITLNLQSEFAADPMLPDLAAYQQPYGLDIHNVASASNASLMQSDPLIGNLLDYEVPAGATVCRDPLAADPLIADLQQPQITQDVVMQGRPGDLDASALQQMHIQPLYQQLDGVPYNQVFMNQSGMNSTQRRHHDLLMGGLDSEE